MEQELASLTPATCVSQDNRSVVQYVGSQLAVHFLFCTDREREGKGGETEGEGGHYCRPLLNCKKCDQEEKKRGKRGRGGTHRDGGGAIKQRWHGGALAASLTVLCVVVGTIHSIFDVLTKRERGRQEAGT